MGELGLLRGFFDLNARLARLQHTLEELTHARVVNIATLRVERLQCAEHGIDPRVRDHRLELLLSVRGKQLAHGLQGVHEAHVTREVCECLLVDLRPVLLENGREGLEHAPIHHGFLGAGQRILATHEQVIWLHVFKEGEALHELDLGRLTIGDEGLRGPEGSEGGEVGGTEDPDIRYEHEYSFDCASAHCRVGKERKLRNVRNG